jgi:hypothetical protein
MRVLVLAFIVVIISFACSRNHLDNIDFCEIISRDQSFVNVDKSNLEKFMEDREIRMGIINENLSLLLAFTSENGFPNSAIVQDSCVDKAAELTIIHAAQINQEKLFKKETVRLFEKEVKKGNLNKQILERALIIMARTSDVCVSQKKDIVSAVEAWGINAEFFKGGAQSDFVKSIIFKEC